MRYYAVVAVAVVACSKAPSPWVRSLPPEERATWPTKCGIPADAIEVTEGRADHSYTDYGGQVDRDIHPRMIRCTLSWNRDDDRLWSLLISVGDGRELTDADLEPFIALVLEEVKPRDRDAVRRIALGSKREARSGALRISGGRWPGTNAWSLNVLAP